MLTFLRRPVTVWILVMMAVMTFVVVPGEQQFVHLARSFLQGKTEFVTHPGGMNDVAVVGEKMYWPQGLFPALVMVPLVFVFDSLGVSVNQNLAQLPMVLMVGLFVFALAYKLGWSKSDSMFWAETFLVSSTFLSVMLLSWSWYFAQVVATLLWLIMIWEHLTKRRFGIIGLTAGALFLTRVTAGFGVVYFVGLAIFRKEGVWNLVKLVAPVGMAIVLTGLYNYVRFGDVFEYGFRYAMFPDEMRQRLAMGVASIHHVWPNLYHALLAGPIISGKPPFFAVDVWGMSVFFTSPWLLWLVGIRKWGLESRWALTSALLIFAGLCLYFSLGWRGLGYRYALDFLPLLLFVLLNDVTPRKLGPGFKRVVWISMVINFLMFISFAK